MSYPAPQTIRRALSVLERLPTEALADLTERLIDCLDASEPDPDLEEETDCCCAEDAPVWLRGDHGPGDPDDAEPGDDDEPDDQESRPRGLRAERDGLVKVWRRSTREFVSRGVAPLPMGRVRA